MAVHAFMGDRALTRVVLDASALPADLATVERLARMQLETRRGGRRLVLTGCSMELHELIELVGLSDVLDERDGGRITPWPSSPT